MQRKKNNEINLKEYEQRETSGGLKRVCILLINSTKKMFAFEDVLQNERERERGEKKTQRR